MNTRDEKGKFVKGNVSWHKGKKNVYSEEAKQKMRLAKLGKPSWNKGLKGWRSGEKRPWISEMLRHRKVSEETKRKISEGKKGLKNPAWKGGVTPEHELIRKSAIYKAWRKAVFERDNYTCQICGTKKSPFNADHIKSFSQFPDLRFNISNGRTLCVPCHRKTDNYGTKTIKR